MPVRIASSPTIAELRLPQVLSELAGRERGLTAELISANSELVRELVRDGRCDLGIASIDPYALYADGLEERIVWRDELVIVVPPGHPWEQLEEIPVEEFAVDAGRAARPLVELEPHRHRHARAPGLRARPAEAGDRQHRGGPRAVAGDRHAGADLDHGGARESGAAPGDPAGRGAALRARIRAGLVGPDARSAAPRCRRSPGTSCTSRSRGSIDSAGRRARRPPRSARRRPSQDSSHTVAPTDLSRAA